MARKKAHKQQKAVVPVRPQSLDELLKLATDTGAAEHVKAYLDAGGLPTMMVEINEDGVAAPMVPLLHAVCLCDHEDNTNLASSVDILVHAGADVNSTCINPDGNSRTALMWACEITGCSTAPMQALLAAGADASLASATDGKTALMIAAKAGNLSAVQALLANGADLCTLDSQGDDAVYAAASGGNVTILKLFMDRQHRTSTSSSSRPPLPAAAFLGQLGCAEWLLSQGGAAAAAALLRATDSDGWTALHYAAANVQGECMIELLLARGADVHACGTLEDSPLHVLAQDSGSVHCAELLLAAGADAGHTNLEGVSAVHCAAEEGNAELVALLLQQPRGAAAVKSFCLDCLDDCCGRMTVLMACESAPVIKLLLEQGAADVHAVNSAGNTCLHVAAQHEHPVPAVCLLIRAGADITATNGQGDTPAAVARHNGNELAALLDRAAVQQE
jgi:ankyrin repeat protein